MEPSSQIRWSPPNAASLNLNFNGSAILNFQAASASVMRDASGSPLLAGAQKAGTANECVDCVGSSVARRSP